MKMVMVEMSMTRNDVDVYNSTSTSTSTQQCNANCIKAVIIIIIIIYCMCGASTFLDNLDSMSKMHCRALLALSAVIILIPILLAGQKQSKIWIMIMIVNKG